jgi:hypothetical protein
MRKQKLLFNQLLRMYNKYIRKRKNLASTNRNHRRQAILSKHIERLYEKLCGLKTFIQKRAVVGTFATGVLLFSATESKAQIFGTSQINPFSIVDIGEYSNPVFADLDGDGDLDLLSGERYGSFRYFPNTGTATAPLFGSLQINPFSLTSIGNYSHPTFADLDNDGDLDMLAGQANGSFRYFPNTGTSSAPVFGSALTNPFSLTDIGDYSNPTFADLDGDGDFDLLAGHYDGRFYYFQNTGSATVPSFGPVQINPFSITDIGDYSSPSLADLDGDGDLDLLAGHRFGNFFYFQNTGTATAPNFGAVQINPFLLTAGGTFSSPELADLNSDGDLDLFAGEQPGRFWYFENGPCVSTSGTDVQTACDSYTWIDGNTYSSSTTTPTYTLLNAAGCDSVVTLNLTILSATGSTDMQTACGSYTWMDGNTYSSSTNTPTYTLINAAGCDSVVTLNLTINSLPNTATTTSGLTITATLSGATYQWIDCNNANLPISGATAQSYTATSNGDYAVIVNDGTCSDTSACVSITTVGLSNIPHLKSNVLVYPNPNNGTFTIEAELEGTYVLQNELGQMVQTFELNSANNKQAIVANLSQGVYILGHANQAGYTKIIVTK